MNIIDDRYLRRQEIGRLIEDLPCCIGGEYLLFSLISIRDPILDLGQSIRGIFVGIRNQLQHIAPLFYFGTRIRCTLVVRNLEPVVLISKKATHGCTCKASPSTLKTV